MHPFHPLTHPYHRRLMYRKRGMPGPFEIEEKKIRLDNSDPEPGGDMILLELANMQIEDTKADTIQDKINSEK